MITEVMRLLPSISDAITRHMAKSYVSTHCSGAPVREHVVVKQTGAEVVAMC